MIRRLLRWGYRPSSEVKGMVTRLFGRYAPDQVRIWTRHFPSRVKADLQIAVDKLLTANPAVVSFSGIQPGMTHEEPSLANLFVDQVYPATMTPPEYEEVDVGDGQVVRCVKSGLWLCRQRGLPYAVMRSPENPMFCRPEILFQLATPKTPEGEQLAEAFFRDLEQAVQGSRAYRGKVISLERVERYSGRGGGILVHKLRTVSRDEVVLPAKTLQLLDRNVIQYVQRRGKLKALGQPTKKGILLYGPAGTGKTHTIHYLAGALPGHTTLLITAEQVVLLGEYMALARLLQPSIIVIEDVDLIARHREEMDEIREQVFLTRLLNEMDGLREDAEILFVLTTNRPKSLEKALAARPGRVDQAIEFLLPDATGREKLVRLYARGARVADPVVQEIVRKTEATSGAFIKELMRRATQCSLDRSDSGCIEARDVDEALDEMVFMGGQLNTRLLGGRDVHEAEQGDVTVSSEACSGPSCES